MNKVEIIQHMLKELDWLAGLYQEMTHERDVHIKEDLKTEYKHYAAAYNRLLNNMDPDNNTRFPRNIEKFINNRELYNAE